jgi:prepilin-type N-terminal cleavage/methylation domain-containing protein
MATSARSAQAQAAALTLIELLVVMAVVGLLASLLLPAIQAAREQARLAACQNGLHQVGIATLDYETAFGEFPIGAQSTNKFGVSWWIRIYPYVTGSQELQDFDQKGAYAGWALLNSKNGQLVDDLRVPSLICPSSPLEPLLAVGRFQLMMPSYVGISGASSQDGFSESRVNNGCDPRNNGQISGGGLLVPNRAIELDEVEDGLSNVIAVGETSDYAHDRSGLAFRIDGGHRVGWITGTSVRGVPPNYREPFAAWNLTTIQYAPNTTDYELPGIETDHGPNNPLVSSHPGGVNTLRADASTHFVLESVDVVGLKQLATRDDGGG